MKKGYFVALLIFVVLLIDQASKFYIKTHFEYNEDVLMGGLDWARLHFVENEGMAFGITFDWEYGKLLLSLFRVLMVAGLIWYLRVLLAAEVAFGFTLSIGLITAGALGNIIDSAFYALIFSASGYHGGVAELTAFGQGYGMTQELPFNGFMHGRVVDMLYFPMTWVNIPEWVPVLGGDQYLFFSPIFNVADASITIGVLCIVLFQRRFFRDGFVQNETPEPAALNWGDAEKQDEDEAPASSDSDMEIQEDTTPEEKQPEQNLEEHPPLSDQPSESAPKPNNHNLL
ncbi:MAG: lipoprotein signal peptidase [Saprospiraceae bacterium]|nr:lipoprotein signal peptidase [Saprospiraceae bacterium]